MHGTNTGEQGFLLCQPLVSPFTRMVMTLPTDFFGRQKFMQWRVDQTNNDRMPIHGLEQAFEIGALVGNSSSNAFGAFLRCFGKDHALHDGAERTCSKNICSVRHRPIPWAP